ncbi:MAG: DUF485 domain-containing protein [Blastocatellia bacterium]
MAENEKLTPQDWQQIAATDDFKTLVATKRKFILPAVLFFIGYYFALPVLVRLCAGTDENENLRRRQSGVCFGARNFMAWILAAIYVKKTGRFDALAERIINKLRK